MVVNHGSYNAFGVFFKPMLAEFGWTRAMISGAFSLSRFVQVFPTAVMGRLTDRFGPRLVLTISGCLVGLGYLLMSRINATWQLYLIYAVIIGMGMSGVFVPLTSTVSRWFVKRRSMMTGIVTSGIGIGTVVVPPLASRLISAYDWRVSLAILGGGLSILVVLAAQLLKRDPSQLGQLPYGVGEQKEQGAKAGARSYSLTEAVHERQFWLVSGMFLSFGFCTFTIIVHIVPHAAELGLSAISAANVLATIGALSILGKVVLGSVADRIGNKETFIISFILMSAALFWLALATEAWMLFVFAAAFGLAFGGCTASQAPLVSVLFGLSSHGVILGVVMSSFTLGSAIGPFLAGYVFDISGSYQIAFLVSAAISIVGLILTIILPPPGRGLVQNRQPA